MAVSDSILVINAINRTIKLSSNSGQDCLYHFQLNDLGKIDFLALSLATSHFGHSHVIGTPCQ